ncbi:hypothetical protein JQC91_07755 [Jannaschia sp. Os4]|uniref:hypothetical protein n=1 Tax=Jannaschia sp. Os4 TaxID=2807617 RepID=UPI00193975C7|nr:hypothetical protein [Jannaschia sp. Os4]MBM2576197.1 hypothetical protein [Jannaschia sp. Os4]
MTATRVIACVLALAAVAGCARLASIPVPFRTPDGGTNRVEFDGQRFRTRISATTPDRRGFAVSVGQPSRSVAGALEAGRHRAIGYCLNRFGGSDILWDAGPDREADALVLSEGALILTGTCTTR